MEGWSQKENGPMDTDNGVVIAGGRGRKGICGNEENKDLLQKHFHFTYV